MKVAWVLFAKPPLKGFVKTRLAKTTGPDFALGLYRLILQWQFENIQSIKELSKEMKLKSDIYVYTATPESLSKAKKIFNEIPHSSLAKYHLQTSGSLGEKMIQAFVEVFKTHDYAIIWGADVPLLCKNHFLEVTKDFSKACIIPATDGGYSLIAINKKQFDVKMMNDIRWSHKKTLSDQLCQWKDLAIDHRILEPISDLDTGEDVIRNILYMKKNDSNVYRQRIFEFDEFIKAHHNSDSR